MSNFIITGFSDEIDSNIKIQFQELNRLGIEYYEPRFINDKNIADLDVKETEELLKLMNEHGIKASSIGSPIIVTIAFLLESVLPYFKPILFV